MESQPLLLLRRAEPCNAWALRRGLSYRGASIPRRSLWPIAAVASPSGPVSRSAAAEIPVAVAPPTQRGNHRCSFRIGEGPALQMLAAGNARNEESPAAVSLLS